MLNFNLERIYKLEYIVRNNFRIREEDFYQDELEYIYLFMKLPYSKMSDFYSYYKDNKRFNKLELYSYIQNEFGVTKNEVLKRFKIIKLVYEYERKLINRIKLFSVKIILELEAMTLSNPYEIDINLDNSELYYIEMIKKIPLSMIKDDYYYFKRHESGIILDNYMCYLMSKYHCSKDEIKLRFDTVEKMLNDSYIKERRLIKKERR